MQTEPTTVLELLDVARDLTSQNPLDVEVMLEMLDNLPGKYLDAQTRGAIIHARLVLSTPSSDPDQIVVARFALARVIVLLERRVMIQAPW